MQLEDLQARQQQQAASDFPEEGESEADSAQVPNRVLVLKPSVETRWNSVFYLVERKVNLLFCFILFVLFIYF